MMKGAIRYTVTVSAVVERVEKAGKDWAVVREAFEEGREQPKKIYGYTPGIEKSATQDVVIFEQSVDELDMCALVSIINNIPVTRP